MKLKLTYSEFMALYSLFNHMVIGQRPAAIEGQLLHALMLDIYKRLYAAAIIRKKKYSISLKEPEALAFWLFFNKHHILPAEMVYEANLIDTINNSIHQKMMSTC